MPAKDFLKLIDRKKRLSSSERNGGSFLLRCGNPFGIMDLQKNKGDYFMSMQIVFEQILVIFGYVIVGYVAGKSAVYELSLIHI